ncbi:ArsR/SmtB family transcription factor [Streptomyces sp. LE64]|uniref:ArsR/SmtB family transcription factor n=1 Tax=Streptomyces sp. LE64 TaxID=3448653 RepID=UPI004041FBAE
MDENAPGATGTPDPRASAQEPTPPAHRRRVRHLDARTLRGLAHPLRMALLGALRRGGPATASQLAGKLGESSGATSYHLRQLAVYGFVEDAPEQGRGRERWWRAVDEGTDFGHELMQDTDPETRGAASVFLHEIANIHSRELTTWIATREDWSEEWARATDLSDFTLRLTPEESRELSERMHALLAEYRPATTEDTDAATDRVRVHLHLFPQHTS